MPKHWAISILFLASVYNCGGQSVTDLNRKNLHAEVQQRISILTGYNFWQSHYLELGIVKNQYRSIGHHSFTSTIFLSTEIRIDNSFMIAPKIGGWMTGGAGAIAMGANLLFYTDFDQGSLRFRPEIGMGFGKWKLTYGYNLPLTNRGFEAVNRSNIGMAFLIGIRKLK